MTKEESVHSFAVEAHQTSKLCLVDISIGRALNVLENRISPTPMNIFFDTVHMHLLLYLMNPVKFRPDQIQNGIFVCSN